MKIRERTRYAGGWAGLAALLALGAGACGGATGDQAGGDYGARAGAASAATGSEADASPLPAELLGRTLGKSHSGARAAEMLGEMHGRGVAGAESYIGSYGPEGSMIVVYVSRFASGDDAKAQLDAMSTRIGSGSGGFSEHVVDTVGGVEVHGVQGHGQVHYFYARGSDVTWLAAPVGAARGSLAELLGVAATEVPDPLGIATGA